MTNRLCSVAVLFALAAGLVTAVAAPAAAQANTPFADLPADTYYTVPVTELAEDGVFAGTECSQGFCPSEPIDRATMAVWMVRVLDSQDPPAVSQTRFNDVEPTSFHAPFIERTAELGVTRGCGDGAGFCPDRTVTRAQMAVFLTRAFDLTDGPDPGFSDVASDAWFTKEVAALATSGITKGCGDGTAFCPSNSTTRAQMATFLHRAVERDAGNAGGLAVAIESSAPLVIDGGFDVTVRFSAPATGLTVSDLTVVNGRADSLAGSGANYTARIEPAARGTVMVRLPKGAARGIDGSPSDASTPFIRTNAPETRATPPGFDTWNRSAVLAAYNAEFNREEPDPSFTGEVENCLAGTTSKAFRDSVIQRVNWYRHMTGLRAVAENATLSFYSQYAALIMAAHGELSHYPADDWACYTSPGARGASGSNLAAGSVGVEAIDQYMADYGDNNRPVGHRRWILTPQKLEMGTGDVPEARHGWNALYVLGRNRPHGDVPQVRRDVREARGFVAWPPPGYVPWGVVWQRWSFSSLGADVSNASVAVTDDSGLVDVEIIHQDRNAIVWTVPLGLSSNVVPEPVDGDHCYRVTVGGVKILNETQTPYEYPVCVIDPNAPVGPSVTVTSTTPDGVNDQFDVRIAFDQPVAGFTQDELFVVNGTVTAFSGSGRQYEATILPEEGDNILVIVGAGAVHDERLQPNNRSSLLLRGTTAGRPTARLSSSAPLTIDNSFDVTIAFSEPVRRTGALSGLLSVLNGTVTFLSCDRSDAFIECTATILPDDRGDVTVSVGADAVHDLHDQPNQASASVIRESEVATAVRPAVEMSSPQPSIVNGEFDVAIAFSAPMSIYDARKLNVLNGSVTSIVCEPWEGFRECTATILPYDFGDVTVTVEAGFVYNERGQPSTAPEALVRESSVSDIEPPTVTISSTAPSTVQSSFDVLITFSKVVQHPEWDKINIVNGAATDSNCEPWDAIRECTVTIVPDDNGEVSIAAEAGLVRDRHGQPNEASASLIRQSGVGRPSVVISSSAPEIVQGSFDVTITFSAPVTGFDQESIHVTAGTVTSISGSGSVYTATVMPGTERPVIFVIVGQAAAFDEFGRPNSRSGFLCRKLTDDPRHRCPSDGQ